MVRNIISTRTEKQVTILLQKKQRYKIGKANFVSCGLFTHSHHGMIKYLLTFCLLHPLHNADIKLITGSPPIFYNDLSPPKPALMEFPSNIPTWQSWLMLLCCSSTLKTASSYHPLSSQVEVSAIWQPWLISCGITVCRHSVPLLGIQIHPKASR